MPVWIVLAEKTLLDHQSRGGADPCTYVPHPKGDSYREHNGQARFHRQQKAREVNCVEDAVRERH